MTALVHAANVSHGFAVGHGLLARQKLIMALRDVDLAIGRGEALGIVGESGCGKSTLGRLLLGLLAPTRGRIVFDGQDLSGLTRPALRRLRRRMQMIFQDPYASLDPRRAIGAQIADGMRIHGLADGSAARDRVAELIGLVGLDPSHAARLPHEFSGGQRQRIAIARALATQPDFVVADEPVSSLDVSVQAQVLNLLAELREKLGLALMFISHDLTVVKYLCERVAVMYLGRIVEEGRSSEVLGAPAHPYTRALLAATPSLRPRPRQMRQVAGEPPSAFTPPSGCAFRARCPFAIPACVDAVPPLERAGDGRRVACLRAAEI
jgi:oligopeptide/dipeptide ABC transporter ATP-binding protein